MSGSDLARAFLDSVETYGDDTNATPPSQDRPVKLGTVDPAYAGVGNPRVKFDGETTTGSRTYVALAPVVAGQRVTLLPVGRTYVILGSLDDSLKALLAGFTSSIAALTARELSGLVPITPSSVTVSSGSASVAAGGEVTVTGAAQFFLNGIFTSKFRKYLIVADEVMINVAASLIYTRPSVGGVWYSGANSFYTTGYKQAASFGDFGFGAGVSHQLVGYNSNISPAAIELRWFDPAVAGKNTTMLIDSRYAQTRVIGAGEIVDNTVFDGLTFYLAGSSTFTGKVRVYGYV